MFSKLFGRVFRTHAIAPLVALGLLAAPAVARAQDNCTLVQFARGASSTTIQGKAPPEGVICYTFKAGADQTAHLQVSGRNVIISVIGVGDARTEWTFKTKAQTNKFIVGQLMRAVNAEPYTVTLSIAAKARCGLDHLDLCQNTNALVWDRQFRKAVERFVGSRRAAYLYDEAPVAEQMLDVLGGPPDDVERIGSLYRFTACRAHSCTEKGAAVLEPNGRVVALGILHGACALQHPSQDCFAHNTLTLFVRSGEEHGPAVEDLTDWAKEMIAQAYQSPGLPDATLDAVEIVPIAGQS